MSILTSKIKLLIAHDSLLTTKTSFPETVLFDSNIDIVGIENTIESTINRLRIFKPDIILIYIENPSNLLLIPKLAIPTLIVLKKSGDTVKSVYGKNKIILVKPIITCETDLKKFASTLSSQIKSLKNPYTATVRSATKVIAIGASTGGTEAILEIIKDLPSKTCAILVVQHMPEVFSDMYAKRLDSLTSMRVREAQNNDRVVNGEILIAAGGYHLSLCQDVNGYYVQSIPGAKVCGHCPSVDVLFDSVAKVAQNKSLGIILTGMGKDGATGLLNMRRAGAATIGQNADTCIVYGMPCAAKNINAVAKELPLQNIANEIINYTNKN